VTKDESKYKGATYLKIAFKATCPETEVAVTASDLIMLPFEDAMTPDDVRKSLAKLKCLQIACGLEDMGNEIDNDLFLHCELQVELSQKDSKDYGLQQTVRDYLPM
jgi:hypothetical protein